MLAESPGDERGFRRLFFVYLSAMLLSFQDHIYKKFPQLKESKILVAISGGVDSVVLTHLCNQSGLNISLAHCNFHLRDAESDADEAFVLEMAEDLNLEVFVEHFDTQKYAEDKKISIQMAARELRYQWFEELRELLNFDYIFTAHHANDDLETFLINFIRGTGLEGFTGIPERNEFILRPLLSFSRENIEKYANSEQFSWREDASNASTKYLRNKIRLEIIPRLEEINPQLLDNFQKTKEHLQQSAAMLEDYISVVFSEVAEEYEFGYKFNIKKLKTIPNLKAVLFQLFRTFEFTEWEDVYHLLDAQSGKMVFSKTHRLIKDRDYLLLTQLVSEEKHIYKISEEEEMLMLPEGNFHFEKVQQIEKSKENSIFVDNGKLEFPLLVRKWQKGDYFYPFGMQGKKKLSKFFKDNKVPLPEKENCWLLCSGKDIVWVVSKRADSRFSVDENTSEILKITYSS